jgi:hypothetical protein
LSKDQHKTSTRSWIAVLNSGINKVHTGMMHYEKGIAKIPAWAVRGIPMKPFDGFLLI